MLVSDVVTAVTRQFGDETGAQIDSEDIIRWVNDGQLRISRRTESAMSEHSASLAIGSATAALPEDFFKVSNVTLTGSSGVAKILQNLTTKQFQALYPTAASDATGVTKFCTVTRIDGNWIMVFAPRPSETVGLTLLYKNRPPVVDAVGDELSIPDEFYSTLITYCLAQAKQLDGDDDAYTRLMSEFNGSVVEDSHDEHNKDAETYPYIRTSEGDC